jgi:hypothetical protein
MSSPSTSFNDKFRAVQYRVRVANMLERSALTTLARFFCVSLLLMVCGSSLCVMASTSLAVYREHVRKAVNALETLTLLDEDEDETTYVARRTVALRGVRELLPPAETIDFNGATVQADNKWLDEALKKFEEMPSADKQRINTLSRITERLHSLDERLNEMSKGQSSAAASDKEVEKAQLAEILRRDEYKDQSTQPSALRRLWNRFRQWLRDLFPNSPKIAPGQGRAFTGVAQIFVIALSLAVIAYVFWKLAPWLQANRAGLKLEKRGARVVLGERLAADQTAADLLAEAEALARNGDLRAAIRKGYIALLCELSDRKLLSLAQHKTNRDYLRDVREKQSLHQEMQLLTNSFENHWYGFTPATENDWNAFRAGYNQALRD